MAKANEMFQKLGYKRTTMNGCVAYKNEWEDSIQFVKQPHHSGVVITMGGSKIVSRNELLACAQLIREMEVSDRAQTMGK